ncbi:uncharacterized protein [Apostichopus japonicus]|uniref:uncharacterized protein n=1 Tax=Stichopus japonicus TaxID=307972 RepID=UPI003AB8B719
MECFLVLLLTFTTFHIGLLQTVRGNEPVSVLIGETLRFKCSPISTTVNTILVNHADMFSLNHKVVLHCVTFNTQNRRCIEHYPSVTCNINRNVSQYDLTIEFGSANFSQVGNYTCQYFRDDQFLGEEFTLVDVYELPFDTVLISPDFEVKANNSNDNQYSFVAGDCVSLSCMTTSRPSAEISWTYPAWMKIKKEAVRTMATPYLTLVNSTISFIMSSSLNSRTISCFIHYAHNTTLFRRDAYLITLDPPTRIYVTILDHNTEKLIENEDTLIVNFREDNYLTCTILTPTTKQVYPQWIIPKSITYDEELLSTPVTYHSLFVLNIAKLTLNGQMNRKDQIIKCLSDDGLMKVELTLKESKGTQHSAVTFAVPLVLLALIIISVTLIVGVKHQRNRQRFVTETVHTIDTINGLAETGMEQLGDGHALNLREGKPSHKINVPIKQFASQKKDMKRSTSYRRSLPSVPLRYSRYHDSMINEEVTYASTGEINDDEDKRAKIKIISQNDIEFTKEIASSSFVTRWIGKIYFADKMQPSLISFVKPQTKPQLQFVWNNYINCLLALAEHKNILTTFGICHGKDVVYAAQRFNHSRTLNAYLKTESKRIGPGKETFIALLTAAYDVISGLEFLTNNECCHPGLCTHRIIVESHQTCKLYAFCKQDDAVEVLEQFNLEEESYVLKSLPPEAVLLGEYNSKSDIWSAGIVMWEIFSYGAEPFPGLSLSEFETKLRAQERLERPFNTPADLFRVIQGCWEQRASKRSTITSLIEKLRATSTSVLKQIEDGIIALDGRVPPQTPILLDQDREESNANETVCETMDFEGLNDGSTVETTDWFHHAAQIHYNQSEMVLAEPPSERCIGELYERSIHTSSTYARSLLEIGGLSTDT